MAEDETDEVPKLPPDARLESLEKRLERLQQAEAAKPAQVHGDPNYRIGQLVLSHLVGAPIGRFRGGLRPRQVFRDEAVVDAGDAVPRLRGRRHERHPDFADAAGTASRHGQVRGTRAPVKIDPMHQFMIEPIVGSFQGGNPFVFTNSALWMLIVLGAIYAVHARRNEARS